MYACTWKRFLWRENKISMARKQYFYGVKTRLTRFLCFSGRNLVSEPTVSKVAIRRFSTFCKQIDVGDVCHTHAHTYISMYIRTYMGIWSVLHKSMGMWTQYTRCRKCVFKVGKNRFYYKHALRYLLRCDFLQA
jgi:hypothetical protein